MPEKKQVGKERGKGKRRLGAGKSRNPAGSPQRAKYRPYIQAPDGSSVPSPWNVPDLCTAYNWPSGLAGGGLIALVEFGGGWVQPDLDQFFAGIGQPSPTLKDVSVDGTTNFHGPDTFGYDEEVALGIEVAGASYFAATGKPAQIQVYWSADLAKAVRKATADGCDVCSISWGRPEDKWSQADALDLEAAAAEATKAGMVLFAGSGDNNSSDGEPTPANVDLPASCPHFIGCGGTTKTSSAETVWNNDPEDAADGSGSGTGGGFSTVFTPMPSWQIGAPTGPGRMVPDVAANADPNTGCNIVVHGNTITRGGTSVVAPFYAGLFAAFGKKLHFVTPTLWQNPMCFNDIQVGNNGQFRADRGPDACTGLGSPIGSKLARLFSQ